MPTTTIRLEEQLRARVATAAERAGKTPHAFILDAIAQTVERLESEHDLRELAEQRWAGLLDTGMSVPWDEARAYLEARAGGTRPRRPAARKAER